MTLPSFRTGLIAAFALSGALALAIVPEARAASTFYTSPNGTGTTCSQGSPCSFTQVFVTATIGSTVFVEPGTYSVSSSINGADELVIEGVPGEPRPVVDFANGYSWDTGAGVTLSGFDLESTGDFSVNADDGTVEGMFVEAADTTDSIPVCDTPDTTVIDTVCVNTGSGSAAWGIEDNGGTTTDTLYNDTFYATNANAYAMWIYQLSVSDDTGDNVTATNVIAANGAGGHDVYATSGGSPATFTMINSDYRDPGTAGGADAQVINGGGNISGAPAFANASTFDFHELASSPTIGVGTLDLADDGNVDFAGLPRSASGKIDIGAFQYQPLATPTAAASPTSALTGQTVPFTASEAADPNEGAGALTYSWRFDDGATATGASVTHAFAGGGVHTATLTVSDGSPFTASASTQVTVNAPPPLPLPALSTVSLNVIKSVSHAKKHPKTSYHEHLSFTLNVAATVDVTIDERVKGKRVHDHCDALSAHGARVKSCTASTKFETGTLSGVAGANTFSIPSSALPKRPPRGHYSYTLKVSDSTGPGQSVSGTFSVG
jgi:hypothetical protein